MEKSRGADDPVDQMSQALKWLRAMVGPPTYSPPNAAPHDGRPRMNGVICGSGTAPSGASFRYSVSRPVAGRRPDANAKRWPTSRE